MKKKLLPTKLYDLAQGKANDREIRTLGHGIDAEDEKLDLIIREAFIPTAQSFGLTSWEEIFGAPHLSTSAGLRRDWLIKRLRLNTGSFTMRSVEEILTSLGAEDFTISEKPAIFTVVIDLSSMRPNEAYKGWIREQLEELLPAHLEIVVIFGTMSWDQMDSRSLTFQQIEEKNYTWDEIDSLEP